MSAPIELFERIRRVLDAESEAIRRLDHDTVLSLNEEKTELVDRLRGFVADDDDDVSAHVERLEALMGRLRHNAMLLAYARNTLRGMLHGSDEAPTYRARRPSTRPSSPRHLSITT